MSILLRIPMFASLQPEKAALIERHAVVRTYPKQRVIVSEGDPTDCLYIILSGRAKVYCSDENGKEIVLNDLFVGDYFGEIALLDDDCPRSASVVTVEPCRLMMISKKAFQDILAENPDIAFNLIQHLAKRVRSLTENVKSLALLDVYGRIAKILLSLATPSDGRLVTEMPLTQQEIANRVGASREMVARIMKDLESGGYISIERKRIVINDPLPSRY